MDNPKPVLPAVREREASPRAKRSKIVPDSSGGVPGPSSAQMIRTRPPVTPRPPSLPGGAPRSVRPRFREQVHKHLAEPRLIPNDPNLAVGNLDTPVVAQAGNLGVTDGINKQLTQLNRTSRQLTPLIKPSKQKQIINQARHSHRLRLDSGDRAGHVGAEFSAVEPCQFGITTNRGKRRAQLVTSISNKLPHPTLTQLTSVQRRGHMTEHPIESSTELSDLGTFVLPRHAVWQGDIAAIQWQLRRPACRGCHRRKRAQCSPNDERAHTQCNTQPKKRDDGNCQGESRCCRVHLRQWKRNNDSEATPILHGNSARKKISVPGKSNNVRSFIARGGRQQQRRGFGYVGDQTVFGDITGVNLTNSGHKRGNRSGLLSRDS